MATLTAYQATNMRVELWPGVVIARSAHTITASDGAHVASFGGSFTYPDSGLVGAPAAGFLGAFDPFGLGPVTGTLVSYRQDIGFLQQFTIDLAAPAAPVFHALRFNDAHLASALVFAGNDTITGSPFADLLLGFAGDDTLAGLGGNDRLFGDHGSDVVFGGDGNDRLRGGAGRDILHGDRGADILTGDGGADQLTGGSGADTFRFLRLSDSRPGSSFRDSIRDFAHNTDRIDLRPIDANATEHGNQAFDFIGSQPFTDTPGQLRYAGHLLSGDTDGDGIADFQVNLTNHPHITAGDLLL